MKDFSPPFLSSLVPILEVIPNDLLPWIAEKHMGYLDDRIHKIDILTDYLAECDSVAAQRKEFIAFVDGWTRQECVDFPVYMTEYRSRYTEVRVGVEAQCERILDDEELWKSPVTLLEFWRDFTLLNELDSLHGMFLTSGRWYVNVMLPVVKELVQCSLPNEISPGDRVNLSYLVARRVITPRFAEVPAEFPSHLERRFSSLFIPVLQYFDRQLLFLFEQMSDLPLPDDYSIRKFAMDVSSNPDPYRNLLSQGIYPPFAWHELYSSKRQRRPGKSFEEATARFLESVTEEDRPRADQALEFLRYMKAFELNYNNYNYKGKFGLVSKYFYWRTSQLLRSEDVSPFLDAILGDRFFEALGVLERALLAKGV